MNRFRRCRPSGARRAVAVALCAAVLSGCGDLFGPPDPANVVITPSSALQFTSVGDTAELSAEPQDEDGEPLDAGVSWNSSDPSVATVSDAGVVTAVGNGQAQITAASGPAEASVAATVEQRVATATKIAGDAQTDTVRATLATPVGVRATDPGGSPAVGRSIEFRPSDGGVAGTETTDDDGVAEVSWTLGETAGEQTLRVLADGDELAAFRATAEPGAVAAIEPAAGGGQIGMPGAALDDSIAVRALDAYGNGRPGATVRFAVARGAGQVSPADVTADAEGRAAARWTLGSAAVHQRVVAVVEGVTDSAAVEAMADTTRLFWVETPATAAVGDTVRITVRAGLEALDPDRWGAVRGSLRWDDGAFTPVVFYQPANVLTAASQVPGVRVEFAATRPFGGAASGAVFSADFVVGGSAPATVPIGLVIDDAFAAESFDDLLDRAGFVGGLLEVTQ